MPNIQIKNLSKTFGYIKALRNVKLEISDGEYVGILGPSGCGKTTLINCITGIIEPDEGSEIRIDNKNVIGLPIEDRGFAMVFQSVTLFPHMTIQENVEYPTRMMDKTEQEVQIQSDTALKLVNLLAEKKLYPRELSSGAQQAAAVARAIAKESKLLILDEPISALDAKVRTELRYQIRGLVKKLGLTAIHITHDQQECLSISDRVVLMKNGNIHEINTPNNLYQFPKSLFTLNFVGETNFFEGYILQKKEKSMVVRLRHNIRILVPDESSLKVGESVVLAIRPENVRIASRETKGTSIQGKVIESRFAGSFYRIAIRLSTDDTVLADYEGPLHLDKVVYVSFDPNRTQAFSIPKDGLMEEISLE
ncbi:MAG: ABC transporter ATP-binding protein [Candidatus Heimdallarchaeota archaeon]|nr:ABC transporter ATP-binding protein [Candidatus Heimdallarchaeota archaeon]